MAIALTCESGNLPFPGAIFPSEPLTRFTICSGMAKLELRRDIGELVST